MIFEHVPKNKKILFVILGLAVLVGILYLSLYKVPTKPQINNLWKTTVDEKSGVTFKYPENLPTKYIHTIDWPPQIQIINESFACAEAGSEIARAGKTEKITINDRIYCLTKETEGAAGSIYTQYAYAFPYDNKTAIFTFSLRMVQCANHDNPQKTECENERAVFNINDTIDEIARSITFK